MEDKQLQEEFPLLAQVCLKIIFVYFNQRLGAAPLNVGQHQSKTPENTRISFFVYIDRVRLNHQT